jgi:hypothetical protein
MVFRRVSSLVTLALVVASASAVAQDKRQEQKRQEEVKLSKPQLEQLETLSGLVDAVMTGKGPAPADVKLKIQQHFVKSTTNVFVPYVAEVSGGTVSSFPVAVYVRAVPKGTTTLAAKAGDYPFTDLYFLEAKSVRSTGADSAEFSRGLQLPAGEFDIYVAMMETQAKNSKSPPKRVVHKHELSVPDLAAGLTTSSIILAKSMEDAPAILTPYQQLEQPFTIGGNKITPTFTPTFAKSGELLFVFFIYNQGLAATGKPDVEVNYLFFRANEAKPFSKAATTSFNATTLPAEFNSSAGHQLVVGQGIPLTSFAPGEYKLQLTIADKTNNQTIMRDVPFTVGN